VSNEFGNIKKVLPASLGILSLSMLSDNQHFQDAAFTSLESIIITGFIVNTLKFVTGRFRPCEGRGAYQYQPFSGNESFPSGHASTAFAFLTPWIFYYPNYFTYSLFIITTGTAIARCAKDMHWGSDVITGSLIGFGIGYILSRWHQDMGSQVKISIAQRNETIQISLQLPLN
jgi:membrane-associated phospholipid phosphatase